MTKTGKITAILIAVSFVVLYVRKLEGLERSAIVTLGLSVVYLANLSLYIANAVKGRSSWLVSIFWMYAVSLYYAVAFFFNMGSDKMDMVSNISAGFTLLIIVVLIWFWTRKGADKSKCARLFWDFISIHTGVHSANLLLVYL